MSFSLSLSLCSSLLLLSATLIYCRTLSSLAPVTRAQSIYFLSGRSQRTVCERLIPRATHRRWVIREAATVTTPIMGITVIITSEMNFLKIVMRAAIVVVTLIAAAAAAAVIITVTAIIIIAVTVMTSTVTASCPIKRLTKVSD